MSKIVDQYLEEGAMLIAKGLYGYSVIRHDNRYCIVDDHTSYELKVNTSDSGFGETLAYNFSVIYSVYEDLLPVYGMYYSRMSLNRFNRSVAIPRTSAIIKMSTITNIPIAVILGMFVAIEKEKENPVNEHHR